MSFLKRILGDKETSAAPAKPETVRREISANELVGKLEQAQPPYLLDVREPYEYMDAHITGATLIPLGELMGPRERVAARTGNRLRVPFRRAQQFRHTLPAWRRLQCAELERRHV